MMPTTIVLATIVVVVVVGSVVLAVKILRLVHKTPAGNSKTHTPSLPSVERKDGRQDACQLRALVETSFLLS
jgi:hypothetical protein